MSVSEVMSEILRDQLFYEESDGGVTFSGGEPFMQPEFLVDLLSECKKEELHTIIDTSGLTSWSTLEKTVPLTNLYLYDLKLMDADLHRQHTGVSNSIILENLKSLSFVGANLRIRLALIGGITDTDSNLNEVADFLNNLPHSHPLDLLPYNLFASSKYARMGKSLELPTQHEQTKDELKRIADFFKDLGINAYYRD